MQRVLKHFRRDRSYSSQERWGVFAALGVLTILVSAGSVILFGRPAASSTSLTVSQTEISDVLLPVGDTAAGDVTLTIVDKKADQPAVGVWTALLVTSPTFRSPKFTYLDWYSPEPNRAFYQTDQNGQVKFPLISQVAGTIEYGVYVANPNLKNDNKYQDLEHRFLIEFE